MEWAGTSQTHNTVLSDGNTIPLRSISNVSAISSRDLSDDASTLSSLSLTTQDTVHRDHDTSLQTIPPTPQRILYSDAWPSLYDPKQNTQVQYEHNHAWKTSWWWWWELGAAGLSLVAFFSIIIVLARYQNHPLSDWTQPIQINSLVAVLTTIGKTAMLVAVAESISQLKWLHFYKRPAPLIRFQHFCDASQGPWGSLTLLRTTNIKATLASIGAIITILGLAIEPMAQQVLEFPTRNVTLLNSTASLGVANEYYSLAFRGSGDDTNDFDITGVVGSSLSLLSLQSAFVNGLVGRVPDVNFTCPAIASTCQWPAFSTLGVCGSCQNITTYERNCTDFNPTLICDYTSPDFPAFFNERNNPPANSSVLRMLFDPQSTETNNRTQLFSGYVFQDRKGLTTIKAMEDVVGNENGTIAPKVDIEQCSWDWCIRDYPEVLATSGTLIVNQFVSEPVGEGINDGSSSGNPLIIYKGNKTGRTVKVSYNTDRYIWSYLSEPLNTTLISQDSRNANIGAQILDFGDYLYNTNMTKVATDLAETVTHELRSQNLDNENATFLQGSVTVTQTYIHVRWPWLILPLAETILAAGLLIASILISQGRPLWKSSALAPYIHPLQGWESGDVAPDAYQTGNDMERLAEGMTVSLDTNWQGQLRMMKKS